MVEAQQPRLSKLGRLFGRAAPEHRIIHVHDIAAASEYDLPESVSLGGARTVLGVPLSRAGEPIGVITLARQRIEAFTARQIETGSSVTQRLEGAGFEPPVPPR